MDGFLSTEGPTLAQAIATAAFIADCAADEIAYRAVPTSAAGAVRIVATAIAAQSAMPRLGRGDSLSPTWRNDLDLLRREIIANRRPLAEYPATIVDLLNRPVAQPLPLQAARTVRGDVSVQDGKIAHFGDLTVHGNVGPSATIRARGRAIIFGNVERSASVTASKQIVVVGGAMGAIRSICGDIQCGFAQNCAISGGLITIRGDAVQCRMVARDSIDVAGVINGGVAYAENDVSAMVIGARDSKSTSIVQVGGLQRIRRLIALASRQRETAKSLWVAGFYAENLLRLLDSARDMRPGGRIKAHREFRAPTSLALGCEHISVEESAGAGTFWMDDETGRVMATNDD